MEYLLNVKVLGPIITILLIMIMYKIVIRVIKKMFSFKSKKIKQKRKIIKKLSMEKTKKV